MSEEAAQVEAYLKSTGRIRRRATQIFLVAVILCAAVVLPPLINVSRYQRQITALMTRSLGRPVRLSSVNLRLLPRPGFVLNNLSVGEAPEFGVEPILSAETVVASIRLSTLLTGKVEVDRISLDNASFNLVQTTPGRWNIEQIMMGGLVQGMTQTAPTSAQPVFRRHPAAFPYLEAKNSRLNLKHGLEKLPYSLTNAQLSFWQESPGVWRLRLRGQPSRTDMEISAGDTGDLRLEATLQTLSGHGLYQMPLKIQAAWRDAQLGQLSRLLLGADQGWRGDLTADLSIQGTADAAQTEARLRATSVRREEFIPASPMDFDIHCGLLYQHTLRAVRNLACNTGIGDGKLAMKADFPGERGQPEATLTLDSLPLQTGLDMLRTLRDGFAPKLSADGKVSGELHLSAQAPPAAKHTKRGGAAKAAAKAPSQAAGQAGAQGLPAFQGELTIAGGALRGDLLSHPVSLPPKVVLAAVDLPAATAGGSPTPALTARFPILMAAPAGNAGENAAAHAQDPHAQEPHAQEPHGQGLNIRLQLTAAGYVAAMNGSAAPAQLRELAYALGVPRQAALDSLSGGQADLDGVAGGPWIAASEPVPAATPTTQTAGAAPMQKSATAPAGALQAGAAKSDGSRSGASKTGGGKGASAKSAPAAMPLPGASDELTGAVHLHRVAWSAPYLAHGVEFPEAVVNLAGNTASASGSFSYGALSGTASVLESGCGGCLPQVEIHLRDTDAATLEGALLGAPEKKSMLSPLIDRVRNSERAPWPEATIKVIAENLELGPVTLHKPVLAMRLGAKELTLESWQANLLGGEAKGTGSGGWNGNQLAYTLEGSFNWISGAQLGQLLDHMAVKPAQSAQAGGAKSDQENDQESGAGAAEEPAPASSTASLWSGGPVDGSGKVELSGLTAQELAASATGTLHFHWLKGTIPVAASAPVSGAASGPAAAGDTAAPAKPSLLAAHFASWTGEASIGGGKITLGSNALAGGARANDVTPVAGSLTFGGPVRLTRAAKPAAANDVKAPAKVAAKK